MVFSLGLVWHITSRTTILLTSVYVLSCFSPFYSPHLILDHQRDKQTLRPNSQLPIDEVSREPVAHASRMRLISLFNLPSNPMFWYAEVVVIVNRVA